MRRKTKILFLTTIEFRPPFNGGTVYSFSLFQALRSIADVDVCILQEKRKFRAELFHKGMCVLSAILSDVPLNVIYHSGLVDCAIPEINCYDFVFVDHIESYEAVRKRSVPCVLIAHNLEYVLAHDKINNEKISSLLKMQERLKRYECDAFKDASGVICISASERQIVKGMNDRTVQLLPAFEAPATRPPRAEGPLRLGFLGPAKWAPNRRTVSYLVDDLLPLLSRPVELILAGKGWENSGIQFVQGIRLMGFVNNTDYFWNNIDLLVAPTQNGAGVNIKICEALHKRVPVLTNTHSARAIFGENPLPDNLMLADTNTALAEILEGLSLPLVNIQTSLFDQESLKERLSCFLKSL